MALKLLKVTVNLEVKADQTDSDDVKDAIFDALQIQMENDELNYILGEEDEEVEDES